MQLSYEFRDRSAGREPDPRDGPDIAPVLRAYSLAYLPPRDLAEKEVLYQIFPHHRVRVADEVLFTFPIQE